MCPDTMITNGSGLQDITDVKRSVDVGVRCVEYRRLLDTGTCNNMYNNLTVFVHR